jgi:transposase InsO family protein
VFLAVILDAYSRRVIGWALDRTMEDSLSLTALRMALSRRLVETGLVLIKAPPSCPGAD